MSIFKSVVKRETGEHNKTKYLGLKLQIERWLGDEWMCESMYLYTFYCKVFQLACLFPSARQALLKIIAEEDIMKGSLVFFVQKLDGLIDNYDYEKLYDEICQVREEIIMGF